MQNSLSNGLSSGTAWTWSRRAMDGATCLRWSPAATPSHCTEYSSRTETEGKLHATGEHSMTIRIAINGYGRIGRNVLRAHYEDGKKHDIEIVAINDLGNAETNAHLTRYDTAHGKFPGTVKVVDATIVYGFNQQVLKACDTFISNASCTTNCLAPLVKPLNDRIGVVAGLMTTVHAYTNDQVLTDVYHEDLRRARSATMNMIPTKTGAASAVGLVMPELAGKLDGYAIRVPTINV